MGVYVRCKQCEFTNNLRKLRQSTLTLTDYRFSTSFDQLGIFEQGDNKSQSGEIQQLHAMCGPVSKCCRFRRSRDGDN